jgi:hypothetical protein
LTLLNTKKAYLVFLDGVCESALPAAVLDALLVRPSLKTFEAADAAFAEVCFEFLAIGSPPFILNYINYIQNNTTGQFDAD